jgi:hypothetical protein
MPNLSFDIKLSTDFFQKLVDDYREFKLDTTSSRKAINCAMTAWHLTDWVFNEFNSSISTNFNSLGLFIAEVKRLCPSLQIMHDITNGSKHHTLTRHNPQINDSNLHTGTFDETFDQTFDISSLVIEMNDGSIKYFEDEIKQAIDFWISYFKSAFNIEVTY